MTHLRIVHSAPAVDPLELDQRAYLAICARPGMSYAELARELGVPVADARASVARLIARGQVVDLSEASHG